MKRLVGMVRQHRIFAGITVLLVAAMVAVGAALFQPWRLFTSSTLNEALPVAPASAEPAASVEPEASVNPAAPSMPAANPAPAPVVVGAGSFQSQEHGTSGTAQLLRLPDGSYVVRLENLASSDGPDVKVWLSSLEAGGDWFKYRSGRYVDLGPVKATHGNQNYAVPAGADVTGMASVVLWCDRFSVAFGSAPLA